MAVDPQNRDLTLAPDNYLYLQNEAKGGVISVHRGPTLVNQTGQDKPVRYDSQSHRFHQCSLEQAVQQFPRADEGDYVILENPSVNGNFPTEANNPSVSLVKGRKIVIPGPWSEALYPGQTATVVQGHRLRSNQYLVAIVYNDKEAEQNWTSGTVAKAQKETEQESENLQKNESDCNLLNGLPKPSTFAVGTRIVIKGSDVSFYIPCTGVEVVKDEGKYVRDAVTLEQLEYCCLIDESGKKEYPRGPRVVFPKPTQVFDKDNKGRVKFSPIELNEINGLHLKVTTNFKGKDIEKDPTQDRDFKEGEELFVTGKVMSIYYPREELAIIEYGPGNKKHFSTAIPKGEGRYVIDRATGEISLKHGPSMLLPDPRKYIMVRRVLSKEECQLAYPGNQEALDYNIQLSQMMAESPSGRSGIVSEGDYRKSQTKRGLAPSVSYGSSPSDSENLETLVGETITRGTRYTQPKTLTLNTKYDGVPKIEVWPGYAVLIVGANGSRRVVCGPEVCLLEYDEKLGFMNLSTGKPKTTDTTIRTAYLCIQNNQVGDIVSFESSDHVKGKIKISLRVNFVAKTEEEKLLWFGTDNYVKYLTDHVRSLIAGAAKRASIADIKGDYVKMVRDAILGEKIDGSRAGLSFDNGMNVVEVEVLDLTLNDPAIAKLLDEAQSFVVRSNIQIQQDQKNYEATKKREEIAQLTALVKHQTAEAEFKLQVQMVKNELELKISQLNKDLQCFEENKKLAIIKEQVEDVIADLRLKRQIAQKETEHKFAVESEKLRISSIEAETQAAVSKLNAAKDGLYETMVALNRDDMVAKLSEATNIERFITGDSIGGSVANILSIMPSLKNLYDKSEDGLNRMKGKAGSTK